MAGRSPRQCTLDICPFPARPVGHIFINPKNYMAWRTLGIRSSGLRIALSLLFALAPDAFVNFLTMHGDFLGRVHADTHLIAFHPEHGHCYLVTDHQGLSYTTCQNQHPWLSFSCCYFYYAFDSPCGICDRTRRALCVATRLPRILCVIEANRHHLCP